MSWDQALVCFGADPVLHHEKNNAPALIRRKPEVCSQHYKRDASLANE
jgi:hypothetical protein